MLFERGLKARNTQLRDVRFVTKSFKKILGQFFLQFFFTQFRENYVGSQDTFFNLYFFGGGENAFTPTFTFQPFQMFKI